jgi:hypothetical protein
MDGITEALYKLIEERAARGNCQSKHGPQAAFDFELFWVMDKLDQLLGETP